MLNTYEKVVDDYNILEAPYVMCTLALDAYTEYILPGYLGPD